MSLNRRRVMEFGDRLRLTSRFDDRRDKPVSLAGNRFDVLIPRGSVPQNLAEGRDIPVEVVLLDRDLGPDSGHQLLLCDKCSVAFNENPQCIESLAGQWDGSAIADEPMLSRLKPIRGELIHDIGTVSCHVQKNCRKKSVTPKDVNRAPESKWFYTATFVGRL